MRRAWVILGAALSLAACEREADRRPLAPSAPAASSGPGQPETNRQPGMEPGRIDAPSANRPRLPLTQVLAIVRAETAGEVIEVELDEDDGQESYEVAVLTPEGRKIEITMDARTGRVLKREED